MLLSDAKPLEIRHCWYYSVLRYLKKIMLWILQDGYAGVGLLAKEKPIQVTYGLESEVNIFPRLFCDANAK
jgi:hypothetical protein